uniref:Major facilitator superfamily (MFS) profile domain-containing protein n=1 Tax=Globodera rostochiensis TaxID=31243 RepID=A0A914I662_GLORO
MRFCDRCQRDGAGGHWQINNWLSLMVAHQQQREVVDSSAIRNEIAENERLTGACDGDEAEKASGKAISPSTSPLWSLASVRLSIAIALALSLAIEGLMRSNINMAMVCMVNKTAIALMAAETEHDQADVGRSLLVLPPECAHMTEQYNNSTKLDGVKNFEGGDLVISKQQQSLIFTSFYLGGLLIILPGSYLCDWLGPTRLVFYGALVNVVGTFVTPFVAQHLSAVALIAVRFLMGCGQVKIQLVILNYFFLNFGAFCTAIAIATTGNQISVILAMFLTAELCVLRWLGGWASAFYIYGLIGVAFCALWMLLVRDYPSQSERIQPNELRLIQTQGGRGEGSNKANPSEAPWRRILSSMVVWSTAFSSFSQNFMNVGIVVYLPTYYHNVLGMDLSSNGLMSALPFVVQLFTKILFAWIADWAKERRLMSSTAITKLFNLIASLGSGFCFILLSFCDCRSPYLAIALAVATIGISSGFIPGYNTSVVCIAPRYTSSIASFSRLLGQIASVVSPYGIGIIVANGTKAEWQLAFWGMAAILFSTGIVFQLFGSASIQEWAVVPPGASGEARYHPAEVEDETEERHQRKQNAEPGEAAKGHQQKNPAEYTLHKQSE